MNTVIDIEESYATRLLNLQLITSLEERRISPSSYDKGGETTHDACLTSTRASSALQQLQKIEGMITDVNSFVMYDLDALLVCVSNVFTGFSTSSSSSSSICGELEVEFLHSYAIKSGPVSFILQLLIDHGVGMEAASYGELVQALRCGCPAERIVYDAPCKGLQELTYALKQGVRVNVNSFNELEKIQSIMESKTPLLSCQEKERLREIGVGVRINPMVGTGSVAILSTAVSSSKFGIALSPQNKIKIMECFQKLPYLRGIMVHVGSQGMSLQTLCEGVLSAVQLANLIDKECHEKRIKFIDIGGGLSVNYDSDEVTPTFEMYRDAILTKIPDFYEQNSGRTIITEFGKSLVAKTAVVISKVEDVIDTPDSIDNSFMHNRCIAIIHSGADLFVRPAYCPDNFSHRFHLLDHEFKLVDKGTREDRALTFAGPLCFSGDVLMKDKIYPRPYIGEHACIMDAGANTISMFSHHCSRASPKVIGFRSVGKKILGTCLREEETIDSICKFWD